MKVFPSDSVSMSSAPCTGTIDHFTRLQKNKHVKDLKHCYSEIKH